MKLFYSSTIEEEKYALLQKNLRDSRSYFRCKKKTICKKYFHGQNMKKKYAIVLFEPVCSIIPYLIAFLTSYA
jgi:hypothetical protein